MGKAKLYTDGSYNKDLGIYGSGYVLLDENEKVISRGHKTGYPDPKENGWNINGEVAAAELGIERALELGFSQIEVYHDYEGIGKWADGIWGAYKTYTIQYAKNVEKYRRQANIRFIHVKGHSGNKWNDVADAEAKLGAKL